MAAEARVQFPKLADYKKEVGAVNEVKISKAVAKARRDNCKGWSESEWNANRDADGYTARERVKDMKILNEFNPRRFPISKFFYKNLRDTFRDGAAPEKALKEQTAGQAADIRESLLKAMLAYKRTGCRAKVAHELSVLDNPTLTERQGAMQFALECKASASPEQSRITRLLFRFFHDENFMVQCKESFGHMKPWLDSEFKHFWTQAKATKKTPGKFIKNEAPFIFLLLPQGPAEKLAAVTNDDFSECQQELLEIVSCCETGAAMYGYAVEKVIAASVDHEVFADAKLLEAITEPLTRAELEKRKKECRKRVALLPGFQHLPDRRESVLTYRDMSYKAPIPSFYTLVEVAFDLVWKAMAVSAGDVPPVSQENEIINVAKLKKFDAGIIEEEVYASNKEIRETINGTTRPDEGNDGLTLANYLKKQEVHFAGQDPTWQHIESKFFQECVGDAGQQSLERAVTALLPTDSNAENVTLDATKKKLQMLKRGGLYRFTGSGPQGAVTNTLNMIESLVNLQPPTFPCNPTRFFQTVQERVGHFCDFIKPDGSKVTGAPAVLAMHEALVALESLFGKDDDIIKVYAYSWLLPAPQAEVAKTHYIKMRAAAAATIAEVAEKTSAAGKKHPSSSSSSSSAPEEKKRKCELDAALAMFHTVA